MNKEEFFKNLYQERFGVTLTDDQVSEILLVTAKYGYSAFEMAYDVLWEDEESARNIWIKH